MSHNDEKEQSEMLQINKEQTKFYNTPSDKRKHNFVMKTWRAIRRPMYKIITAAGIKKDINELQLRWMGDLSDKKILDFGCYSGNELSIKLAENSKSYYGVDLSDVAIAELRENIEKRGITNAHVQAVDILSTDFLEKDFDVIYAQGVLHHFKHIESILSNLADRLKPNGIIVTSDPLQTAVTSKIMRAVYRPFQSNKSWEWPFTEETLKRISQVYEISAMQGFMGLSKWSLPVAIFNKRYALRIAKALHKKDMEKANRIGPGVWRCLQVAMLLKKKDK